MTDVQAVRREIIGDGNFSASFYFTLAVLGHTRWPVDAFTVRTTNQNVDEFIWIRGEVIGHLKAHGDPENPNFTAVIRPLSDIANITLLSAVNDEQPGRNPLRRAATITFKTTIEGASGQPIDIGATDLKNARLKELSDALIDQLLDATAGSR